MKVPLVCVEPWVSWTDRPLCTVRSGRGSTLYVRPVPGLPARGVHTRLFPTTLLRSGQGTSRLVLEIA